MWIVPRLAQYYSALPSVFTEPSLKKQVHCLVQPWPMCFLNLVKHKSPVWCYVLNSHEKKRTARHELLKLNSFLFPDQIEIAKSNYQLANVRYVPDFANINRFIRQAPNIIWQSVLIKCMFQVFVLQQIFQGYTVANKIRSPACGESTTPQIN